MILVTGASGFIGHQLCKALSDKNYEIIRANKASTGSEIEFVKTINHDTNWSSVFRLGVEVVIHLAPEVCAIEGSLGDQTEPFEKVYACGTLNLANQAAVAGVKRFIYLSSIKVNGETTLPGRPFSAVDITPSPNAYATSKARAEMGLMDIASKTDLEIVIIRPPLVYGPGVKGNFLKLLQWLSSGRPLPYKAIKNNRRSMIGLGNLIDFILVCKDHPKAANQIFLVCDGEDLSTFDLLTRLGHFMGCPARLWNLPEGLLYLFSQLTNTMHIYDRLCGSLQVDMTKTCDMLGWSPPFSVDQGLKATVEGNGFASIL